MASNEHSVTVGRVNVCRCMCGLCMLAREISSLKSCAVGSNNFGSLEDGGCCCWCWCFDDPQGSMRSTHRADDTFITLEELMVLKRRFFNFVVFQFQCKMAK